jgi:hypothetical protein
MRSFENINEETIKNGYRVMHVKWASSMTYIVNAAMKKGRRRVGRIRVKFILL